MKYILLNLILPIAIIGLVSITTFWQLTNSFYEQDEWLGLGNVFVYGSSYLSLIFNHSIFKILLGEGRILSSVITYFFYSIFPFNSAPVTLFAIILHILNTILVFLLAKTLFKKTIPALLGSIFFSVNAVSQSAVTWGAAVSTLPATTITLFSLMTFFKSINFLEREGQIKHKWLMFSFILLYISLLFKQIGIFLIPIYFMTVIIYSSGEQKPKEIIVSFFKKYLLPLILFLVTIIIYLITYKSKSGSDVLFLTGSSANFYQTLLIRTLFYPLASFSQLFVPPEQFLVFARHVTNIYYPFFPPEQFILIAQTTVLDLLSIILSVVILVLLGILSKYSALSTRIKIWFIVVFTLSTFLPYVLISKSFSYLDSRYYYLGAIGASFIITWSLTVIKNMSKYCYYVSVVLVMLFIFAHASLVKSDLEEQSDMNQERKVFLTQLRNIKPDLETKRNIFFISGSDDFYVPGHKVPFQNGMGHTLLVWYYNSGNVPRELIKEKTMFVLGSQGYYEYNGLGFGYFSDINKLKEAMSAYSLQPSMVIALYYDEKNKLLINNTEKFRNDLLQKVQLDD